MFGIYKKFIKDDVFDMLKTEINFNHDYIIVGNQMIKEERKTYWMSDFDYPYKYGEKIMQSNTMTKNIKYIQSIIEKKYGKYYDSVLINYYDNGNVGMRYHSDATYDEWEEDTVVISFGANRKIAFREIANYDNKTYFDFSSGDMIFMKDGCQSKYQHRVLKDKNVSKDRISLVFKKHK